MDLAKELHDTFQSPEYRPPTLPAVGLELIQLTYRPDVEYADVLRVLERDPLLAGRVLQLSQSPIYATRVKPSSLERAVLQIGLTTLREIVWEVVLSLRLFRVKGYTGSMERVRRHSTAAAYVTRVLARYTGIHDEEVFLTALLHDCGVAGALIVLSEYEDRPKLDTIWGEIHQIHQEASSTMVRLWNLAEPVREAEQIHHTLAGRKPTPLQATLCLADYLATDLGASIVPAGEGVPGAMDVQSVDNVEAAMKTLGLDNAALALIRPEAEDVIGSVI